MHRDGPLEHREALSLLRVLRLLAVELGERLIVARHRRLFFGDALAVPLHLRSIGPLGLSLLAVRPLIGSPHPFVPAHLSARFLGLRLEVAGQRGTLVDISI